ncbi:MAG TPA: hypothetical protein VIB39_18650 [Candidatus Angelobacter sp.]|jgi:hypothetical protein
MKRRIGMLALLCVLVPLTMLGYIDKRQPTEAEEKAITKYVTAVNKVFDQLGGPDWDEHIEQKVEHPMVNVENDRPLDIDQLLRRNYEVRPDSRRFQTLIVPRQQKLAQLKDASQKDLLRAQTEDLKYLQVEAHFNMLVVPMMSGPDPRRDPKVTGATFAHQDRNNPFGHGVAYVLFFSNGRAGKWDETNGVYRNTFVHPPNSPYIENVEIRIYGAEDRIHELLRKLDWKQVNAALTQ